MSLALAAIAPHPLIMIPSIGKDNINQIDKTINAFHALEENLYLKKIDTIIIISPHGLIQTNTFTLNLNPEFNINFEEFGDFSTKFTLSGDVGLAHQIKEDLEATTPIQAISKSNLDYGCGVPLYALTNNLKNIQIIPMYYSGLDLDAHYEFGKILKKTLLKSKKRIAVIASGDLSHRITKDSPAGYSSKGAKFDKKLINYLTKKNSQDILKMRHDFIQKSGECGLKSIVILLGILDGINYTPNILSYEFPFGVGYLTMNFNL